MSVQRLVWGLWLVPFLGSWAGLWSLIFRTSPQGKFRQLFFLALFLAASTLTMPVAHYLQERFAPGRPSQTRTLRALREGMLAGLLMLIWAWLQMVRALNWVNGLILLAIFVFLELFLLAKG